MLQQAGSAAPCAAACAGLSAALFAPAWVWEVGDKVDWLQRQQVFWGRVQACCQPPRALVRELPFSTCFDQGAGLARYSEVSPGTCVCVCLLHVLLVNPGTAPKLPWKFT